MDTNLKQDIVHALRKRRIAENELPRLLKEAEDQATADGSRLDPATFAETVPLGNSLSQGSKLGRTAAVFMLVFIGAQLFMSGVLGVRLGIPGIFFYYGAGLVVLIALVSLAYYLDRKLPRE